MTVAIAPWSIVLTPGKPEVVIPQGDLQIKNAALPDELQDDNARTSVKLTYRSLTSPDEEEDADDEDDDEDDENEGAAVTTVLCSLTPGKIEQSPCEIILEQDNEYILEVVGKNSVHVYGNYVDQAPVDQPPFGSDMDSDEEDAYNLGEVSSDVAVEVDADEADLEDQDDAERFEELTEQEAPAKTLKRPREDAMETDEPDEKLSKSQKKKLAKKLKAADGQAAPAPAEAEKKVEEKKVEKKEKKEKKDKKDKKDKSEPKQDKTEEKDAEKKDDEKKGERTIEGGVKVRDPKVGTGKMAKKGDKVEMRYIGKLMNGTVFDKCVKGKPFTFTLGRGEVIRGWDVGIAGMQIGGEREIIIPPSMGYGGKKTGDIPANSTLRFEVKLLEIK